VSKLPFLVTSRGSDVVRYLLPYNINRLARQLWSVEFRSWPPIQLLKLIAQPRQPTRKKLYSCRSCPVAVQNSFIYLVSEATAFEHRSGGFILHPIILPYVIIAISIEQRVHEDRSFHTKGILKFELSTVYLQPRLHDYLEAKQDRGIERIYRGVLVNVRGRGIAYFLFFFFSRPLIGYMLAMSQFYWVTG
jgi:hypothetical protein